MLKYGIDEGKICIAESAVKKMMQAAGSAVSAAPRSRGFRKGQKERTEVPIEETGRSCVSSWRPVSLWRLLP